MVPISTPVAEILRILLDRNWHEISDANQRYRLSAIEIYYSLEYLRSGELVDVSEGRMRLRPGLDEKQVSMLNRLLKTSRPSKLDIFDWGGLQMARGDVESEREVPWD